MATQPRLAELLGALSLATDLGVGLGYETALRSSLIATSAGRMVGLDGEALSDVYYTSLLRFVGCTAFAHETAWLYGAGDDNAFLAATTGVDSANLGGILRGVVKAQPKSAGAGRRVAALARLLSNPGSPKKFAASHCELAMQLARKLEMRPSVIEALAQLYERWDGRGNPSQRRGDAIAMAARLTHLGVDVAIQAAAGGLESAMEMVRDRRGRRLDPALADAFLKDGRALLAPLALPSAWEAFLAAEPSPARSLRGALGDVAHAFALFTDVKSPFTLGHSTGVARLAQSAAQLAGLPADECERVRVAALLHDLGRVSVPNGIWDKPGPLNDIEWERVRQHATHTARILGQSSLFAACAPLAAANHERVDGSGYPRGARDGGRAARLLAASDTYHALTEARAYRPARSPEEAARTLAADARHDRAAVDAVLAAAGQPTDKLRGELPAGLSEREREVLVLLARGLSNKEIAQALSISPKTAQHHVAHIFEKTGVANRAAAATYAVVNGLVS